MSVKRSIRAAIADNAGFPENTLGGVSSITVYSGSKLTCEGCTGVISCREDEIKLRMCDGTVTVKGSKLLPLDFHYKTFSISGRITDICFE